MRLQGQKFTGLITWPKAPSSSRVCVIWRIRSKEENVALPSTKLTARSFVCSSSSSSSPSISVTEDEGSPLSNPPHAAKIGGVAPDSDVRSLSSNSGESEDSRWLREEQRWLREEQRWLREESRWISERESLLREISMLRLRLQQLESEIEHRNSLSDSLSRIASVSQTTISLPSPRSESLALPPSSSPPPPPAVTEKQDPTVKEKTEEEDRSKHAKATKPRSKTLKVGSEGEEVRLMQEALLNLGFYSGEEDMEYSAFSLGTDLAVRTWQSSIGAPEDGIMTDELLKRLYSSQLTDESDPLGNSNGAALAPVTESPEIQQTIVKKEGKSDAELYKHRVYLLGENRWEEPSRVIGNDKQGGAKRVQGSPIKCIVCRGEGRLICTECDGSGEPNIEPQFLEWVDEGTKCPYCEGLGSTPCDTCEGKLTV